jgi:anti-sigma factor RsiW
VTVSPNKLFDYLDGKLPSQERAELEAQMANDSNLLRQLAIARKLRDAMPGSPEMVGSLDESADRRGAVLSRRVALAFIVLVFLNVFIGLWFIFLKQKQSSKPRDLEVQRQVEQSLAKAAVAAMPTPNIEADEIKISASPQQREEEVADKVIATATAAGGSAAKALNDESGIVVLVDIPKNRERDFRQNLVALGASKPVTIEEQAASPNKRKFLQVHVTKAAPDK